MPDPVDHTIPTGPWTFDADVAGVFDDMLRRSIPQYDVMRAAVHELAIRYATPESEIVDLGASRGEAIAPLIDALFDRCTFAVVEVSPPMLDALRSRFGHWQDSGTVRILDHDLRTGLPPGRPASVILAVLTLQFVPVEYRARLVGECYRRLRPGGALIVVEKLLSPPAFDALFASVYHDMKRANGYSDEEIDRKRLSLEGVLVPLTERANVEFLTGAGFHVEPFWRWFNFAGFLAVKP